MPLPILRRTSLPSATWTTLSLSILLASLAPAQPGAAPPNEIASPLSPDDSLKHFQLEAGLRIELAAAEPQVIDPVAMRFDEQGMLWVVEMRDYPHGPAQGEKAKSRIRILRDTDADGRFETAVTFADHLPFATGVQPWQGGVFVTLAGRIAYLKDATGDNVADIDETWFTGFAQENSQLRANHPRFALDNHIYVANGLRGGTIVNARDPQAKPIDLKQMDFRFDPRTGKGEAVSGGGQFGLTFDDYGNRFVCSNRNPVKHVVLEDRYLKRNPFLAVTAVTHDVAAAGELSKVFPISRAWTTSTLHAGQFTAACGLDIYRGDALPTEYYGNAFTCEPTGNLVHREVISPQGATFTSRPPHEGKEFLASPDEWFRPVNLEVGPEGAMYVVDMYRAVIEHPQFMPDELKNRPDLTLGDDRGRIYRVISAMPAPAASPRPELAKASSSDLVKLLSDSNAWWRETALRLLYERQDLSVQPDLEALVANGERPVARLAALHALAGMQMISEAVICRALCDGNAGVRRHGMLLAEPFLKSQNLQQAVLQAARKEGGDASFRFQAALTLGELPEQEAIGTLWPLALQSADDAWTRIAVASAVPTRPGSLLAALLSLPLWTARQASAGQQQLAKELAALVGARKQPEEIALVLAEVSRVRGGPSWEETKRLVLLGMAQALARRGSSLWQLLDELPSSSSEAAANAERLFARAAELAGQISADLTIREQAIALLAYARYDQAGAILTHLVNHEPAQQLRLRAIEALSLHRNPEIAALLLTNFASQTPIVRRAVLDAVLSNADRAKALLDEIEARRIGASELDRVRADRLVKHADPKVRQRAIKLLADALPEDRQKVLSEYQIALTLKADAGRGREVFQKNCSTCHRIAGIGVDVAPDIADSRVKKPDQLLVDILQPNRAIDSNFVNYIVASTDGRVFTGIVTSDTASSITLKQPEGKIVSLLRPDIEEIRSTGVSLMPEGLEKNIDQQQMADLISFIKNWRYLDGRTPLGND